MPWWAAPRLIHGPSMGFSSPGPASHFLHWLGFQNASSYMEIPVSE